MKLTWEPATFPPFGDGYELTGMPDDCNGQVRRSGNGKFVAMCSARGRFMSHNANTLRGAMRRLERELDKRSIGLFNADFVSFDLKWHTKPQEER